MNDAIKKCCGGSADLHSVSNTRVDVAGHAKRAVVLTSTAAAIWWAEIGQDLDAGLILVQADDSPMTETVESHEVGNGIRTKAGIDAARLFYYLRAHP